MEKTSTGLQENVAGLLCYVLGWVSGIIFLVLEKDNKTVRFHAIQSIAVFGVLNVACPIIVAIFSWIPILNVIVSSIVGALVLAIWIFLMVTAILEKKYKMPWAGNLAEKNAG